MAQDKEPIGAVLVAGGGIAGMQAALDLANSGYQVYLVESKTAIGGRMAQLDKTFPTNDCAMCTISPRLVEVGTHPNIEILTNARVAALNGEPGRFAATVSMRPNFIDLEKCTGCGLCAEICPVPVPDDFNQFLADRKAISKLYPQAVPNKYAIDRSGIAPCLDACPVHGNPSGYIALIAAGKFQEAYEAATENNPFPSICGRVCVHLCEENCNRANLDSAVSIAYLKRFLADWHGKNGKRKTPAEKRAAIKENSRKVAVVGSGPGGMAAAARLRKLGYSVTVFEKQAVPGGMMRLGIPAYRLPAPVIEAEIQDILDMGVDLKLNSEIEGEDGLSGLFAQGFESVFLSVGSWQSGRLRLPGEELAGVRHGVEFLRDVRLGKITEVGSRVIVIGGGNVAIDCARSAVRLGAKSVKLFCLEDADTMPAHGWEIEWAKEEGVEINPSRAPKAILGDGGKFGELVTLDVEYVSFKDGKLDLRTAAGSENSIQGDEIIIAIGQRPDAASFGKSGKLRLTPRGTVEADPVSGMTSWSGVFAGGDFVRGAASIIEAVADGQRAAESIDAFLNGRMPPPPRTGENVVKLSREDLKRQKRETKARQKMPAIPLEKRKNSFDEVELGFSEEQARLEAQRCLYCAVCSNCQLCSRVCQANALLYSDKPKERTLEVGAVVLSPGFDLFDAAKKGEYGYRRFPNVLSSLDYERVLSASGPFQGHIKRPSDGRPPKRIAFIQCVGSREEGNPWCSSVCCMFATKQAIITKEHIPGTECTILVMDVRAFGKGFDEYYERAKEKYGVRFVHTRPSSVRQDFGTKNLFVQCADEKGSWREEEFDLVVLSAGLCPSADSKTLARVCGIELNPYSFAQSARFSPSASSREGIYLAGAFEEPKDIPESVTQASAAAAQAMELLAPARGTRVKELAYPDEKDVAGLEPRIGVFVCHCGSNIGGFIDCDKVAQYAAKMRNVVFSTHLMYTCSPDGLKSIRDAIEEHKLNRVVVASCTPRTHEPLFQKTIRERGLNAYLFEMANIRDQCTWVHARMGDLTEKKAMELVRMAVARSRTIEPLPTQTYVPKRMALVVGGGVAGMTAATSIARQGYRVHLVEKSPHLGGNLEKVKSTIEGLSPAALLGKLLDEIESNERILVHTSAEILETTGFTGNFKTKIKRDRGGKPDVMELEHGAAIIATGASEMKPEEYLYGANPGVMTQQELESRMERDPAFTERLHEVVMIQCVGSRQPDRMVCCRVGCTEAVKNAILLKRRNPQMQVYVLYRDMRTYGFKEDYYTEARRMGVLFFRYDLDAKPQVSADGAGKLEVKVKDLNSSLDLAFSPDALVLSAAMLPSPDNHKVGMTFKVPVNLEGFFLEAHMKLRPVDFASDGIFLCGTCHSPKFIEEAISQAKAAAARAVSILSRKVMEISGVVSKVNAEKCAACLTCVRVCPYNVPRITDKNVAEIETAMCHGCGICASECPAKAIELMHYKDHQVLAKTNALFDEEAELEGAQQ